jgi:hypothetical protein
MNAELKCAKDIITASWLAVMATSFHRFVALHDVISKQMNNRTKITPYNCLLLTVKTD